MHSLNGIALQNAYAAGREYAHAVNDGDDERVTAIEQAQVYAIGSPEARAFFAGYNKGRAEK